MKQRKGFTLIELMIVIAIIIILAAIAIPNYLRMTDRARRARVAGDFAALATSLEAYEVDWGAYPVATSYQLINKSTIDTYVESELGGAAGTATPTVNISGKYTLTGEGGPIDYIKSGVLLSMYNPFNSATGYNYGSKDGLHWVLYCTYKGTDTLSRTDSSTDLAQGATPSIP